MNLAHEVVIALGSNQGSSIQILRKALHALPQKGVNVIRHSALYETDPKHIADQPTFLNAAVLARTQHKPLDLLAVLKEIEADAGRDFSAQRFGPRPLDLDIIFYGSMRLNTDGLVIPHPRWKERPFVLAPITDLHKCTSSSHTSGDDTSDCSSAPKAGEVSGAQRTKSSLWTNSFESRDARENKNASSVGSCLAEAAATWWHWKRTSPRVCQEVRRMLQVRQQRWLLGTRSFCMGILNVTPDSFSDGNLYASHHAAVQQAVRLADQGADVIDIGGQSTRPGAAMLTSEEEMARVIPVVQALRSMDALWDIPLSIDTFHSRVAAAAVQHGADMVNDVSGGRLDPDMLSTVAELGVPYVLMHMRGDPATMQSAENQQYTDVVEDVASELSVAADRAVQAGVAGWNLVLDPGIGFAKGKDGNLELIRGLGRLRKRLEGSVGSKALLVGPSRKAFLGALTGRRQASERDAATVAAVTACVANGADIVRVHNVVDTVDGLKVADALFRC